MEKSHSREKGTRIISPVKVDDYKYILPTTFTDTDLMLQNDAFSRFALLIWTVLFPASISPAIFSSLVRCLLSLLREHIS